MLEFTDFVLRTATVMSTVLLAALLASTAGRQPAAVPGAFFCLAVASFFVTSVPGVDAALGAWQYPLTALCVTKAAWYWLFARALFNDEARLRGLHFAIAGTVAVVGSWQQLVFLPRFRAGVAPDWETAVGIGFDVVLLAFVVLALREAWRDMAIDLVEHRRRLRVGFVVATGGYLAITLGVQSYNLLLDVATPVPAVRANMAAVTAACVVAAAFLLQIRSQNWLDPTKASAAVTLRPAEAVVLSKLERALEADRVHLQEGLTISGLASRLGTSEPLLRSVIHRGMGYRNFNDFLHEWRIREACEKLARPDQVRRPILSIAMDVGYGSIGAFNRAFKDRIGMTPTAYRRNRLNGVSLAP